MSSSMIFPAYFGVSMIFSLLIVAVSIGSSAFLGLYVYHDAKHRGIDNSVIWVLLAVLTGIIGLIIYIVIRKDRQPQWICMGCGVPNGGASLHCSHCGKPHPTGLPEQSSQEDPKIKRYLYLYIGSMILTVVLTIMYIAMSFIMTFGMFSYY